MSKAVLGFGVAFTHNIEVSIDLALETLWFDKTVILHPPPKKVTRAGRCAYV